MSTDPAFIASQDEDEGNVVEQMHVELFYMRNNIEKNNRDIGKLIIACALLGLCTFLLAFEAMG